MSEAWEKKWVSVAMEKKWEEEMRRQALEERVHARQPCPNCFVRGGSCHGNTLVLHVRQCWRRHATLFYMLVAVIVKEGV